MIKLYGNSVISEQSIINFKFVHEVQYQIKELLLITCFMTITIIYNAIIVLYTLLLYMIENMNFNQTSPFLSK